MLRRLTPLLLFVALATGCAPTYKHLPTVDQVPELADLARQADIQQIEVARFTVGHHDDLAYSIAVEETGAARDDELIVLVHGLVSDRTTWKFVAGKLGKKRRLWIPDQLGCGESDRPDPREIRADEYSPSGSARQILTALRQRNERLGWPERIVFVGHSLGGAVVLRILGSLELRADFPEIYQRMDAAVLIAPLDVAVHRASKAQVVLSRIGRFWASLGFRSNPVKESVTKELLASAEVPEWVLKADADRIIEAFRTHKSRLPTQAILSQAMPLDDRGRPQWETMATLVADYENVSVPVLLIWGARDETLPLSMGYKLLAELPDARLRIATHGKHSLQADRPAFVADWIERFLQDSGAGWARVQSVD